MPTIQTTRDASLKHWAPDVNYGDDPNVSIAGLSDEIGLIGFDIDGYAAVNYAMLYIRGYYAAQPSTLIEIRRCLTEFAEMSVTWNNRPSVTETDLVTGYSPNSTVWRSYNITTMFNAAIASGGGFLDLELRSVNGSNTYATARDCGVPSYLVINNIEYTNIYVDPVNGSDSNAGTQAYPLASLSLAASRVNANGSVHIKAGSVWSPSAGEIGPTNKPVTYYTY